MVTAGEKRTPYPNGQGVCELSVLLTCVHRKSKTDHLEPFHPRRPLQEPGLCRFALCWFQPVPVQCQFGPFLHEACSQCHILAVHVYQRIFRLQSVDHNRCKSSMHSTCTQDGLRRQCGLRRQVQFCTELHDVR